MKTRNWDKLSKEQRTRLIEIADSLFIPPDRVSYMYENYQINLP